ncbi:MAG: hypothetical protein Q4G65_12440 [bacterium]|nr:hypothetical protein [bacterium]
MPGVRRDVIHSMLRRLNGWDYRQRAIYQITLTLADRTVQALGRLEVKGPGGDWLPIAAARGLGLTPEAVEARVVPSELGEAALLALAEMPRLFPEVAILRCQLMPDHLHFIIFVQAPIAKPLGALIRGFKAGASKRWKGIYQAKNGQAQNQAKNGQARNSAREGDVPANSFAGLPVWGEGYQDTILFRDGQLANMKRYLADNPRRLAIKRLFPDLFRVVGEWSVPLSLPGGVRGRGRFAAIGNRFLLDRPLAQVQVSRRDFAYAREAKPGGGLKIVRDAQGEPIAASSTPFYAEKKAALFAAARHGAVLISPCVSDGERQIAREALQAGLPLVTMLNKGFSPLQKPGGRHFDACAEGRLLMLAPAAWPHQPGEKPMTRFDATAMNRLCQWIVGDGAAEINYHGMRPANIDALAVAAARVERDHKVVRNRSISSDWTESDGKDILKPF